MNNLSIENQILEYLYKTNAIAASNKPLPLDQSLYDLGIIDSLGVIELVEFIEKNWDILINEDEMTRENIGGIKKMEKFISMKLNQKNS